MFNAGLSLEQAPPISVVLRFFLTVPFFGLLLSALMIFAPMELLTPSHPLSLAAIHLILLGVITMSMIGALFQMQSVLGGRPIPSPMGNALIIHTFLVIGILSLAGAFIFSLSALFVIAAVMLGAAIIYTANIILPLLFGGITHDTLRGMRVALISLAVTAILGIVMATSYANDSFSPLHDAIRTSHYSLGLIGWIGALIIAVAFQVVEMFYVTTPYSQWCKRNGFRIIAAALTLKILWLFLALPYVWVFDGALAALLTGFAVTTIRRLRERKRRVSDVSIWFWGSGIALLQTALIAHIAYLWNGNMMIESVALIAFSLFALSIILGMMGKIVPFLVWFHLSSKGFMDAPIMSNVIRANRLKAIFWLFIPTAVFALAAPFYPTALRIAGLTSAILFALVFVNLLGALKLYRHTLAHGTRFEQV
ncbi:hypothetical protein [Sulfuricurvum sp.]|uniref:hypothetical protein n=1 Tax=Sulfuricurvum sp. TaxID=2025608 RepID=UPI003566C8FE